MDVTTQMGITSGLDVDGIKAELNYTRSAGIQAAAVVIGQLKRRGLRDKEIDSAIRGFSLSFGTWLVDEVLNTETFDQMADLMVQTAKLHDEELNPTLAKILVLQVGTQLCRFLIQATKAQEFLNKVQSRGFGS
jgi:hypothetical protein